MLTVEQKTKEDKGVADRCSNKYMEQCNIHAKLKDFFACIGNNGNKAYSTFTEIDQSACQAPRNQQTS